MLRSENRAFDFTNAPVFIKDGSIEAEGGGYDLRDLTSEEIKQFMRWLCQNMFAAHKQRLAEKGEN